MLPSPLPAWLQLLGAFEAWLICPHAAEAGCSCRKPAPGLIRDAATALGIPVARCAVIGDIGADVEAARAAGARAIIVPTAHTRAEEVAAAPERAATLAGSCLRVWANACWASGVMRPPLW